MFKFFLLFLVSIVLHYAVGLMGCSTRQVATPSVLLFYQWDDVLKDLCNGLCFRTNGCKGCYFHCQLEDQGVDGFGGYREVPYEMYSGFKVWKVQY